MTPLRTVMTAAAQGATLAVVLCACIVTRAAAAPPVPLSPLSPTSLAAPTAIAATPVPLLKAQALRDLLGLQRGKVVVLNLWATWCAPCLREIPVLIKAADEFAPRGVVLIGVAMDEPQSLHTLVEPFHAKFFPRFTTWLRDEPDMDSIASVVDQAWNEVLPTTYVIGRSGKLLTKIQGARSEAQFRETIEAALRAP